MAEDEMISVNDMVGMGLGELLEIVEDGGGWCAVIHEITESRAQLSN